MKKRLLIGILGFAGLLTACSEDEIDFYTGPAAVNITIDGDGTFVQGGIDLEKTFDIQLAVQGEHSDKDRVLKFAFGKEHTAVAGTNFELPMEVTLEAGRLDTVIQCKVFREGLTTEPLMFDLMIDPTGDFAGGVYDEVLVKMMIGFPTAWVDPSGWAADYWLGKCTQAKYAFVFEQLGTVDLGPYQGNFGMGYMNLASKFNEILEKDEMNAVYPYQKEAGYRVNQAKGLIALGLFKDYEEIRNWPTQFGEVMPGDIKYKDINGDGKIDDNDKVAIGATKRPNFTYGFGMSVRWKGLDLNVHFQGVGQSTYFID